MAKQKEMSFEESVKRLEEILEKMNSGKVTLDESLQLFEEADKLITSCNKRLHDAEQKVEILLKNRQGELSLDQNQSPETEDFDNL